MPSIHDVIHGMFVGGYLAIGFLMGHNYQWWHLAIVLAIFTADFTHREAITPDRWDE